jgi:hypothetical protein
LARQRQVVDFSGEGDCLYRNVDTLSGPFCWQPNRSGQPPISPLAGQMSPQVTEGGEPSPKHARPKQAEPYPPLSALQTSPPQGGRSGSAKNAASRAQSLAPPQRCQLTYPHYPQSFPHALPRAIIVALPSPDGSSTCRSRREEGLRGLAVTCGGTMEEAVHRRVPLAAGSASTGSLAGRPDGRIGQASHRTNPCPLCPASAGRLSG